MTPTARPAREGEAAVLGRALGRAFADDPIWAWIYPQPDAARRLTRMFRTYVGTCLDRGATVLTDEQARGAAVWQRHDARTLGAAGNLRMGWAMLRTGANLRRGQAVLRAVERAHPTEPHWYLALLGTDPDHQGTGVGSALIRQITDDPSNAHEAAYLETETEANVAFYLRHGFQVIDEVDVPGGGPHLWFLWRDPPAGV